MKTPATKAVAAGKPNWRTAPRELRLRAERYISEGMLRNAVSFLYDAQYSFTVEDIRELAVHHQQLERMRQLDAGRAHHYRVGEAFFELESERRALAYVSCATYQRWASEPVVDKAAERRAAVAREEAERAAFIEARAAALATQEATETQLHYRSRAAVEFDHMRRNS